MKTIFFDIDGTLTETISGSDFKQHPQDLRPMPGVDEGLHYFSDYLKIGISNQGGVAAGKKTLDGAIEEMKYTLKLLPQLDFIYFCPDYEGRHCYRIEPRSVIAFSDNETFVRADIDSYRKPGRGMALLAAEHCGITLSEDIYFIGDRPEDNDCAINAGISFLSAKLFHDIFTKRVDENSEWLNLKQKLFLFGDKL